MASDLDNYARAISSIESGGNYASVGPATKSGDRAYGKYQVMGANVPGWTEAALGVRMTPDQFLANPQAQDAVFNHRFGGYVSKYGNPQDAASAWFTGRPLAQGASAKDVLGTTGSGYVDRFNAALGLPGSQASQGAATASAPSVPSFGVAGLGQKLAQQNPLQVYGAQMMAAAQKPVVATPLQLLASMYAQNPGGA